MIAWFKRIYRKLRAPEGGTFTLVHCNHNFEVLAVSVRVSDIECRTCSPAVLESHVTRWLCRQLAEELFKGIEVIKWTDHADPCTLASTYTARIRVLRDGAAKETK
jgi:hypothetical protein